MCGICGRFNFDGRPVGAPEVVDMRDVMVHRGPDGHGLFVDGPIGLGHRRLAIIDLEGGHQPLVLRPEPGVATEAVEGLEHAHGTPSIDHRHEQPRLGPHPQGPEGEAQARGRFGETSKRAATSLRPEAIPR